MVDILIHSAISTEFDVTSSSETSRTASSTHKNAEVNLSTPLAELAVDGGGCSFSVRRTARSACAVGCLELNVALVRDLFEGIIIDY